MSEEDNINKVDRGSQINMWAVSRDHKKRNTGSPLVKRATEAVVEEYADEVMLEMEITKKPALKLYDPVRKRVGTEDVNHMTGLTADTPRCLNDTRT